MLGYRYYSIKNTLELQRKQSGPNSLLIKFESSGCLHFLCPEVGGAIVSPRYLMDCFPYIIQY